VKRFGISGSGRQKSLLNGSKAFDRFRLLLGVFLSDLYKLGNEKVISFSPSGLDLPSPPRMDGFHGRSLGVRIIN